MSDDRKDLPPVNAPNFNERLRETISTYLGNRGNKLDRGLTLRDLVDANIIKLRNGFLAGNGGTPPVAGPGSALELVYEVDLTPPPTPTGFVASAAISNIFIEHDAPLYLQGHGHAKTVVYGATWTSGALPVFGDAVKITEFTGTVFAHPTNPATTWHLWIKWVTVDGVESESPAGGVNGKVATTGQDVRSLLEVLTGELTESQLYAALGTRISLIDAPITTPGSVNNRLATETVARTNALAEEATTRAQALLNESAARANAVNDLQNQISTVVAVAGGDLSSVIAVVNEEQTARAAADAAEAASRETLAVQMRGAYTGTDSSAVTTGLIYSERVARISALDAEVTSRNAAIVSSAADAGVTQKAINDALIAGMGVLGGAAATRTQAEQDARVASVTQETNARISAIDAEASARLALVAVVDGNAAIVVQEQLTRANADGALASRIDSLVATTNTDRSDAAASVQSEAEARTTAISAESNARTTLASALRTEMAAGDTAAQTSAKAYVDSNFYTKTTSDTAIASQNTLLRGEFASADAATLSTAQNYTYSKATIDSSQTTQTNTITAAYQSADVTNLNSAKSYVQGYTYSTAQANDAIAGQVATVSARLNSGGDILNAINNVSTTASAKNASFVQSSTPTATKAGDLWIDTGNANLLKRWTGSAWVAAEDQRIGATVTQVNTLQSTVNGQTTAIQTEATTRASQTGDLYAQYTVKVDVNGYVAGYGLASTLKNGVPSSEFIIRADTFAIAPVATDNTAADGSPFFYRTTATVINGVSVPAGAYMKAAFIHDATITNAKIANLAVDDAKIANLVVSKLDAGSLKVGAYISSSNYIAGSQGFRINANGLAEFSNVVVRGTVYATAGTFSGELKAATGTFSGSLSAATGTFSGSISAATGTFTGNVHGGQFTTGGYTGYGWPAAGNYGTYVGPYGLLMGNANNGKYIQFTSDGSIYTPGFDVVNGVMTVKQANVINTLNLAGNAVTIPVSAAASAELLINDISTSRAFDQKTILTAPTIDATYGSVVLVLSVSYSKASWGTSYPDGTSEGAVYPMTFGFYRNGSLLRTISPATENLTGQVTELFVDLPGGAATYSVVATSDVRTAGYPLSSRAKVTQRTLVVLGVKR